MIVLVVGFVVVKMKKTTVVACHLTSQGLEGVIKESRLHNTGADVVAVVAVELGCEPLANALVDRSSELVKFKLEDAGGDPEYERPAIELLQRPPSSSGHSQVHRIVVCFLAYRQTDFLYELCMDHVIEP